MLATECDNHEAFQKLIKHFIFSSRNNLTKKRYNNPQAPRAVWLVVGFDIALRCQTILSRFTPRMYLTAVNTVISSKWTQAMRPKQWDEQSLKRLWTLQDQIFVLLNPLLSNAFIAELSIPYKTTGLVFRERFPILCSCINRHRSQENVGHQIVAWA